jgi:hypothetical protein
MPKPATSFERDIRRHPLVELREKFKAGLIPRVPRMQLSPDFKVALPAHEDFIVRFRGRGARPKRVVFLRSRDSSMTAFADRQFEIELIGTNAERWDRSVAAEKRAKSVSYKPKKQAARGGQTR